MCKGDFFLRGGGGGGGQRTKMRKVLAPPYSVTLGETYQIWGILDSVMIC